MYSEYVGQFRIVATFHQDLISSICVPSEFELDVKFNIMFKQRFNIDSKLNDDQGC